MTISLFLSRNTTVTNTTGWKRILIHMQQHSLGHQRSHNPRSLPNHMFVTSRKGEDPSGNWSHFVLHRQAATLTGVEGNKPQWSILDFLLLFRYLPAEDQRLQRTESAEPAKLSLWALCAPSLSCSSKPASPQRCLPSTLAIPRGTEGGTWSDTAGCSRDSAPAVSAQQKVISASGPAGSRPSPLPWRP